MHSPVYVDMDTVAVLTPQTRVKIKGHNMALAVKDVLNHFSAPKCFNDVAQVLSKKYSSATLNKMLGFLVDKHMLIAQCDAETFASYDTDFKEKTFFYTAGGKSLQEIAEIFANLHVGLIGTYQLTQCLIDNFQKGKLLPKFNVSLTDKQAGLEPNTVISESDFIIVACNYENHYLFNKINEQCQKENKKWLRVVVEGANAEIGPLFIPGETLCYSCLHSRQRNNMEENMYIFDDLFSNEQFHNDAIDRPYMFSSLYPLSSLATNIAYAETMKHYTGLPCNVLDRVLIINDEGFNTQLDHVYRDYLCPICV